MRFLTTLVISLALVGFGVAWCQETPAGGGSGSSPPPRTSGFIKSATRRGHTIDVETVVGYAEHYTGNFVCDAGGDSESAHVDAGAMTKSVTLPELIVENVDLADSLEVKLSANKQIDAVTLKPVQAVTFEFEEPVRLTPMAPATLLVRHQTTSGDKEIVLKIWNYPGATKPEDPVENEPIVYAPMYFNMSYLRTIEIPLSMEEPEGWLRAKLYEHFATDGPAPPGTAFTRVVRVPGPEFPGSFIDAHYHYREIDDQEHWQHWEW